MAKPKTGLPLFGLMALALFLLPNACLGTLKNKDCGSSLCGSVLIRYPLRLKSQPLDCGYHVFELDCDDNNRTTLVMKHGKFYVQEIFYENSTMRAVDASLGSDDCSLLRSSSFLPPSDCVATSYLSLGLGRTFMFLVNCTRPVNSSLYIDASRCSNTSSHPPNFYFYFLDEATKTSDFNQFCTVIALVPVMLQNITGMSASKVYEKLLKGFEIRWEIQNGYCSPEDSSIHKT
ncbi:hypothetical protein CRYUN_Cryun39dG0056500 [Craigia yunnanensis]